MLQKAKTEEYSNMTGNFAILHGKTIILYDRTLKMTEVYNVDNYVEIGDFFFHLSAKT